MVSRALVLERGKQLARYYQLSSQPPPCSVKPFNCHCLTLPYTPTCQLPSPSYQAAKMWWSKKQDDDTPREVLNWRLWYGVFGECSTIERHYPPANIMM